MWIVRTARETLQLKNQARLIKFPLEFSFHYQEILTETRLKYFIGKAKLKFMVLGISYEITGNGKNYVSVINVSRQNIWKLFK